MPQSRFEGALTALVTPFKDGEVDERALAVLIERQIAAGVDGLVVCGTTGESPVLSDDEQARIVRRTVEIVQGRIPTIAGAGSTSTAHACHLARAAREAGADGLLLVTPYYNRPTQEGLVRHFQALVEAAHLPAILYNVPARTGCDLLPETVARLAELPEIVAIKEATGSPVRASQIRARLGDRLTLLSGDDLTALSLYAIGARGIISVTANVAPASVARMWDAAANGDFAKALSLHDALWPLSEALFLESNPIPVKAAVAMLGLCSDELRPPLYPMTAPARDRLRSLLATIGVG